MSKATILGDLNTGHDSCPPVALVTGSLNVFINGRAAGRVGDSYDSHGCHVHPSHVGKISKGSSSVFINGEPAGRIGDPVSCGGSVAEGSVNVFIGG